MGGEGKVGESGSHGFPPLNGLSGGLVGVYLSKNALSLSLSLALAGMAWPREKGWLVGREWRGEG